MKLSLLLRSVLKNAHQNQIPGQTIYLVHVKWITGKTQLEEYFRRYGRVKHVTMFFDPHTGLHRGFASLTFDSKDAARRAMEERPHIIDGDKKPCVLKSGRVYVSNAKSSICDLSFKTPMKSISRLNSPSILSIKTIPIELKEELKHLAHSPYIFEIYSILSVLNSSVYTFSMPEKEQNRRIRRQTVFYKDDNKVGKVQQQKKKKISVDVGIIPQNLKSIIKKQSTSTVNRRLSIKSLVSFTKEMAIKEGRSVIPDSGLNKFEVHINDSVFGEPYPKNVRFPKGAATNHRNKPRKLKPEEF